VVAVTGKVLDVVNHAREIKNSICFRGNIFRPALKDLMSYQAPQLDGLKNIYNSLISNTNVLL
jgi:hypothetical protein